MVNAVIEEIKNKKFRSAWDKGVQKYALELLEEFEYDEITEKNLLNGARDWKQYSQGCCSLVSDYAIATRLCTPSELKKTNYGEKNPNNEEDWLLCQARALSQASYLVLQTYWDIRESA